MKSHARVVVIGGGVVGCSVLYHLTKFGWTDVVLVERSELTSGSTWHAAGGMHTINGDPNVAKLQKYTVELYREIEEYSGQDIGLHMTSGLMLAATPERFDWMKSLLAKGKYANGEATLISAREAHEMMPLLDPKQFVGAVFDPHEGHLDPYGTTHAYAKSAKKNGAEIYLHTKSRIWCSWRTAPGVSSPTRGRSRRNMWSMPPASGRARWAAWSGWNCPCLPWSTCI